MNIFFNEKQSKILSEALMLENEYPDEKSLLGIIDDILLKKMYAERLRDVTSCFSDDVSSIDRRKMVEKSSLLLSKCSKIERPIRPHLEKICFNVICEIFSVPKDTVAFECHLVDEIDKNKTFRVFPNTEETQYEAYSDIVAEKKEIEKRKTLQSLIIGASNSLYEHSRKLFIDDIFELNEELPHLYSRYVKTNNLALLTNNIKNTDRHHHQGGYVNVKLGDEENQAKITVEAVNFPILLIESIKGFLELFASFGLPDDKRMAKKVISNADVLQDEPWHMKYGPILWKKLMNSCDGVETEVLPYFIKNISEVDADGFCNLLQEIFYGTNRGKMEISSLKENSIHQYEYNGFENDMIGRQSSKELIGDSFSSEELEEPLLEDYPSHFNMEEFKSLHSFRKRMEYCDTHLQRLGSGSARIVYKIDDGKVLKLAKNKKGIAQNEAEHDDYYPHQLGLVAEVYDADRNYLWIEMELARKAKPSDFKRITGYSFRDMCSYCDLVHSYYTRRRWMCPVDSKTKEYLENIVNSDSYEYSLWNKIYDYMAGYGIERYGDLKRISSWGVVSRYGEDELVLIDFGITDDIYDEYYV